MKNIYVYDRFKNIIKSNSVLSKNITGTLVLKGMSIAVGFLSTPAYLVYFSEQKVLGIWFTILSILNWILTFDLGIGNGLRNNLVGALVKKDYHEIKKQISSAYIILGLISIVTLIFGWVVIGYLDWNDLLNINTDVLSSTVLVRTIRIVFCGIVLQFWFKIITSIFNAMQKNVLANSLGLVTNISILIFLLIGKTTDLSANILNLAYVNVFAVVLPLVFATFYAFLTLLKEAKPSINYYDKSAAKKIVSLGGMFFIIQLGLLVVNSTNQLLITSLYSSEAVVKYQVYYKFFGFTTMIFSLFTQPIWSATADAYERGEIAWIKKAYKFLNIIALLGGIACFVVIPKLQFLFNMWLGKNTVIVTTRTALIFATLACCEMFMYSATCIANGIGKLKCQFMCTIIAALLKIPATIFLSMYLDIWESVVIAYILVIIPTIVFQPVSLRKYLWIKDEDKKNISTKKFMRRDMYV